MTIALLALIIAALFGASWALWESARRDAEYTAKDEEYAATLRARAEAERDQIDREER